VYNFFSQRLLLHYTIISTEKTNYLERHTSAIT